MQQYKYISLNDTLAALCLQIKRGQKWADKYANFTKKSDEEIFYLLKGMVNYKADPKGNELLQKIQTFVNGSYWGEKFSGDCDCFTIFTINVLLASSRQPAEIEIVLVGKNEKAPCHIYTRVNKKVFDLTNSFFNEERPYKFRQILPLKNLCF